MLRVLGGSVIGPQGNFNSVQQLSMSVERITRLVRVTFWAISVSLATGWQARDDWLPFIVFQSYKGRFVVC